MPRKGGEEGWPAKGAKIGRAGFLLRPPGGALPGTNPTTAGVGSFSWRAQKRKRIKSLRFLRKLEKAVAVRNSLLERFSGKFRRCWKILPRFSGSAKCYACQGLGTFRQGKRLLENWPRLRERCWIFSSETATAFLSSSDFQIANCKSQVLV